MPFRFNRLLEEAGLMPADVRLLRHQPVAGRKPLLDLWRTDRSEFESYQALQVASKRASFLRPYWASFIGTWDGRTLFVGLYAVGTPETVATDFTSPVSGEMHRAGEFDFYPATPCDLLSMYEGKLAIDWGGGASGKRAWTQRAENQDKLVTELHLEGVDRPFPGLMRLATPLSTLADVPATWVQPLSGNRGVYLLTCPRDGSLYVGSATAEGGFWARWSEYRANGHGGNIALVGRERSDFTISILQVAGSTDTTDDILAAEQIWKRKLHSRDFGLNRN